MRSCIFKRLRSHGKPMYGEKLSHDDPNHSSLVTVLTENLEDWSASQIKYHYFENFHLLWTKNIQCISHSLKNQTVIMVIRYIFTQTVHQSWIFTQRSLMGKPWAILYGPLVYSLLLIALYWDLQWKKQEMVIIGDRKFLARVV